MSVEVGVITLDLGYWTSVAALGGSALTYGGLAYYMLRKPADLLESAGQKASPSSPLWATVVSNMRITGVLAVNLCVFLSYYLLHTFLHGRVAESGLLVAFLFNASICLAASYRAYYEDAKSEDNDEDSTNTSKKIGNLFGTLTALVCLAWFFNWLWSGHDGNYVVDDLHGLPDDLALVKKATGKFIKQHFMGY